jgi:hypothetical protein
MGVGNPESLCYRLFIKNTGTIPYFSQHQAFLNRRSVGLLNIGRIYIQWLCISAFRKYAFFYSCHQQGFDKALQLPPFYIPKLISQQQGLRVLIELNSGDREGFEIFGHRLGYILLLSDYLILELAVASCIEGGKAVGIDTDQTLKGIQKYDVSYLFLALSGQYLMAVAHEISNYCVAIVTSRRHNLTPQLYCH